jgi:signal transduction histidine kinase/ligand-binding sensor domain-containing protein
MRGHHLVLAAVFARAVAGCAIVLLLAPMLLADVSPSSGDYLISVWQTEQGLPDNSVTSIQQTPDGYLWIGTYSGLVRFDGVRFVTYEPQNTPALKHPRVQGLYVDAAGTLWISTFDGSLTSFCHGEFSLARQGSGNQTYAGTLLSQAQELVFVTGSGTWLRRPAGTTTSAWEKVMVPDGVSARWVCQDRQGTIWFLTAKHRVARYQNGRFDPLREDCGMLAKWVNCLTADAQGRIWAGTDREIAAWDGQRFENRTPADTDEGLKVDHLFWTRDGGCWVGSSNHIRLFNNQGWAGELPEMQELNAPAAFGFQSLADRQGGAWFGHYGKGLFHVDSGGQVRRLTATNGLPGGRVAALFEDREGNLWAGINRGGLVRLRERHFQIIGAAEGLAEAAVISVCEDRAGDIWLGTWGAGLYRWHEGVLTGLTYPSPEEGPGGYAASVFPTRDGRLWVGTHGPNPGLYCLREDGAEANLFKRLSPVALFEDRQGRLWEGDGDGVRLGLAVVVNNEYTLLSQTNGYAGKDARVFAEDATGAIWIGTGSGILYRFKEGKFTGYRPTDSQRLHAIWSLAVDDDGAIWAGTFGGGLLRFHEGEFTRATTRQGLPNDVIGQILDDGHGQLWCGSYGGIFRVSKAALRALAHDRAGMVPCVSYGQHDGLPTIQCAGNYQPSCWRGRDGRLWFATLRGAVSVKPEEVKLNPLPPPVVIEDLLVDGESIPGVDAIHAARASSGCRIAPGRHYVEFRYAGLSFCAPDKVQFKFKLEGLQKDWVQAGIRRAVSFGYLPPGNYRFQVTACNNDGVWNENGASLAFVVLPSFWQTSWFVAAVLAATALAAGGVVRVVTRRKLRRRLERLERERVLEKERGRIAKDIHDDLGASLTRISLLSQPAADSPPAPGQAAAQFAQINSTARELTRAMGEIVWAINPAHDSLDSLSNYLGRYAQEFLSVAGVRCRLDMPMQLPAWELSADTRHNLFLAFKEALNNVVKHANAGEARITLTVEASRFILAVEDNGRGFNAATAGQGGGAAAGNGLSNIRQRLAEIGGECVVQSQFGLGTQVRFIVPVKEIVDP